jgi:hypothetical protein
MCLSSPVSGKAVGDLTGGEKYEERVTCERAVVGVAGEEANL